MEPFVKPEFKTQFNLWLLSANESRAVVVRAREAVSKQRRISVLHAHEHLVDNASLQYDTRWNTLNELLAEYQIDLDPFAKEHTEVYLGLCECRAEIAERMDELDVLVSTPPAPTPPGPRLRLPEIRLPEFHGDHETWPQYWELFTNLVDSRADLPVTVKFTYLRQSLKGVSTKILSGFTINEANYDEAKALLIETYLDKDRAKRKLILQALHLKTPKHDCKELAEFRTNYKCILRSLKAYEDVEASSWIFSELLVDKLCTESRTFLYGHAKAQYFTLDAFDDAMKVLIDLLEASMSSKKQPETTKQNMSVSPGAGITPHKTTVFQVTTKVGCAFCDETHYPNKCPTYVTLEQRKNCLMKHGRCFKCGQRGHIARSCPVKLHCFLCKGPHWVGLCPNSCDIAPETTNLHSTSTVSLTAPVAKTGGKSKPAGGKMVNTMLNRAVTTNTLKEQRKGGTALPTALLTIKGYTSGNKNKRIRCFFDSGSQKSFLHPQVVQELGLKSRSNMTIHLAAFGHDPVPISCPVVKLRLSIGRKTTSVEFLVTDQVAMKLQMPGLTQAMTHLRRKGVKLAEVGTTDVLDDISAVIGADNLGKFITGVRTIEGVDLMNTAGGYIVFGQLPQQHKFNEDPVGNTAVTMSRVTTVDAPELLISADPPISQLWELDAIGIKEEPHTPNERNALQLFADNIQYKDCHYWVRLPWKLPRETLPTNYRMAIGQCNSMLRHLTQDPDKLQHYDNIIQDYLEKDFIEKVESNEIRGHYLPHHAVVKDSITTPLRIVFNASAKSSIESISLNDVLETGPSLTETIVDSLLSFRIGRFGLSADISKAFLRVGLQEIDRDYVRFLWVKDINASCPQLQTFRFKSVLFGSTSSPFLLQGTLYKHFENAPDNIKTILQHGFYVDNFQTTVDSESDLYRVREAAVECLKKANMPLQEWNSNSKEFNHYVSDLQRKVDPSLLGITWKTEEDLLCIKSTDFSPFSSLTKRGALSLCSKPYDPLGLLSPITIRGKLLIRNLWKAQVGWDEPLSDDVIQLFNELLPDYNNLDSITFPRLVCLKNEEAYLHVFCDASTAAYGCVSYVVTGGKSSLLMSRSPVAPIKTKSIPQLELTALLLGCRLANYICSVLPNKFKIVIWGDNLPSLQWIEGNKSDIVYVRNRVGEILTLQRSLDFELRHVPTECNPADILSRGSKLKTLSDSTMWREGPDWLGNEHEWPNLLVQVKVNEILTQEAVVIENPTLLPIEDISCLHTLLRKTELCFKYLRRLRPDIFSKYNARSYWIHQEQLRHYPLVFEALKLESFENRHKESRRFIKDLSLYLDRKKIIRSKGRLNSARTSFEMNNPILLSPKSHLCSLIITNLHELNHHAGVSATLTLARNEFWIPHGRQCIKKIIHKCVTCRYDARKAFIYPGPPPLPVERVTFDRPFQNCGVDFTGALKVKDDDDNIVKQYVCLFTCTATRAVHLELIDSLSAEAFLLCFRRFVARCSIPDKLFSDNGTNFVATNRFLVSLQECNEVRNYFVDKRITWVHNSPRASWQGGMFERLIGVVKSSLHKALHHRQVSSNELATILMEVEAVVNNRPLVYVNKDVTNEDTITPAHMLYGRKLFLYPTFETHDYEYDDVNNIAVLHAYNNKINNIIKRFTVLWSTEYLQSLREKHYLPYPAPLRIPCIGEVVVVKLDTDKSKWVLGKIVSLLPGIDGAIREALVLTNGKTNRRTVDKLIPLEITPEPPVVDIENEDPPLDDTQLENEVGPVIEDDPQLEVRPRRQAAIRADASRRDLLQQDLI